MKTLSVINLGGDRWVMSNYTGEIARPWELKTILNMVLDFFRY